MHINTSDEADKPSQLKYIYHSVILFLCVFYHHLSGLYQLYFTITSQLISVDKAIEKNETHKQLREQAT